MARVTGTWSRKTLPRPGTVLSSTRPLSARIRVSTASTPTPRPDTPVTSVRVVKPGSASSRSSEARSGIGTSAASRPRSMARCRTAPRSMPRPSSATITVTPMRARSARSRMSPSRGLPRLEPLRGGLDAVVRCVPHQVGKRVGEAVEHRAVELDVAALDLEPDLLAQVATQVSHHAGESVEDLGHRRHAGAEHAALQAGHQPRDPAAHDPELRANVPVGDRGEAVPGHDQLADVVDQPVEPLEIHPYPAAPRPRSGRARPRAGPGPRPARGRGAPAGRAARDPPAPGGPPAAERARPQARPRAPA